MLKKILKFPFVIIGFIIGKLSWYAPPWLRAINNNRQTKPRLFWLSLVLILGVLAAYRYYINRPQPISITAVITAPALTPNTDNPVPDNLAIRFKYAPTTKNTKFTSPRPKHEPSVARIDLIGKAISKGINIKPHIPGTWKWRDDRHIMFKPLQDWPAGVEYTVEVDKSIFADKTRLANNSYSFSTRKLSASISEVEFYQDPLEPSIRRVVATLSFSHPIKPQSLQDNLRMSMRPSGSTPNKSAKDYSFTIKYDKNQRIAYIHSEPISLPQQDNYMTISLAKGVSPAMGGKELAKEISAEVLIPSLYSFLKVKTATTRIIANEEKEPEQILMLGFTDDISEKELLSKMTVYLLPKKNPRKKNSSYWRSPREVQSDTLLKSEKISLALLPNERPAAKNYSFRFDVPEGRYLYLYIEPGLRSTNNFIKSSLYDAVLRAPSYQKELKILGDGSILTGSGQHKLTMLSRGLEHIKVTIGKVTPGQIYHLVSQTSGDITDPYFSSYNFSSKNLAAFSEEIIPLKARHPKKANYSSIDLSHYLSRSGQGLGLFFINAQGWDLDLDRRVARAADKRLILVTDLGLLVKNNTDQSHDVFIQSIQTGKPVANAKVELLGINGAPLFTATSKADGHVHFPSTKDFRDEKQPTVYLVKTAADISFIPFNRSARQINYSHFDIGGAVAQEINATSLNAYLFSDRGIYRPGEKVKIGAIVKNSDLGNVSGIPLELVINGPRHNAAKIEKLQLPNSGFFDFTYPTTPTSDTGVYRVNIFLVGKKGRRGKMIGSASFRVEEFQPDTMKIASKIPAAKGRGWLTEKSVLAKIKLQNLFGAPAQNRKVRARISVRPATFYFKEYKDYTFSNPFTSKKSKPISIDENLDEQHTDNLGQAEFNIPIDRFASGTYSLNFRVEGFEADGGRSVTAQNRVILSPMAYLVGYKSAAKLSYINKNATINIDLLAIDSALQKIAKPTIAAKLIKIKHLSTLVKQKNGTYKYQTVARENVVDSFSLDITENGGKYSLPTAAPGDFALEIYNEDEIRLSRIPFNVVGHANLSGNLEKNAELSLKLNKKDYKPGETIEMNISAPYLGAGLISIESDRVHTFKWFKTTTTSTMQSIQVPTDIEGNAYVNLTFIRDVNSKEIFTSPLSYAVAPFSIDRSKRDIKIDLEVADIIKPGTKMTISYKTSKPAKIIVFAVDDGILQVAKYKTPRPLDHFLRKRALGVRTLQILDLILPEFDLVREVSATGGGMARRKALAKNINPFSRKTDAPAVFWSGVIDADTSVQDISFTVPDTFAGGLRVMAVAVNNEAIGTAETATLVRGPFVISANVLTQAAPGDIFEVTASIANLVEGSGKNAPVTIAVIPSEHLEIIGPNRATLTISEGDEDRVTFKVKAKRKLGAASLQFIARLGDEEGRRTTSLSVRPPIPYYASFVSGVTKNGTKTINLERKLYPDLAAQKVAASASPLVLVAGLSSYLEHFPHGCTEQVVSQVFPLIGLLTHPGFLPQSRKVRAKFAVLIDRLRERQLANGGFAFWPGGRNEAEYPSVYAMHFLIEARDLGYAVPIDMLQRGQDFLYDYAGRDPSSLLEARIRANAIYLLARLGVMNANFLVHLQTYLEHAYKNQWQQDLTAVYMAAAYKIMQKDNEANSLIRHYKLAAASKSLNSDFHSPLAMDAQYIYLLAKHFANRINRLPEEELLKLIEPIFRGEYNTISAAYSILALGAYTKERMHDDYSEDITFTAVSADGSEQILTAKPEPFLAAKFKVSASKIELAAHRALFYLASQAGFDTTVPNKVIKEGLEISKAYLDAGGNEINKFTQGQEITVRLRIRTLDDQDINNVAVIDLLPGGFEVIRDSVPRTAFNWRADYVDIREDRVVFYGSFDNHVRELKYRAKLTAAGKFITPPAFAESMYDRAIRATSLSGEFEVITAQ